MEYFVIMHRKKARDNCLVGITAAPDVFEAARQLELRPPEKAGNYFEGFRRRERSHAAHGKNGIWYFFGGVERLNGVAGNHLRKGFYYLVQSRPYNESILEQGQYRGIVVAASADRAIRTLGLLLAPDTLHFRHFRGVRQALDEERKVHYSFHLVTKLSGELGIGTLNMVAESSGLQLYDKCLKM